MVQRLFAGLDRLPQTAAVIQSLKDSILQVDWAAGVLGAPEVWPGELQYAVRLALTASHPRIVLIGPDRWVICNVAARALLGDAWTQGSDLLALLPDAEAPFAAALAQVAQGYGQTLTDQKLRVAQDGIVEDRWFNIDLQPIADQSGRVIAALLSAFETSEFNRAAAAKLDDHPRMAAALEAGGIVGTWELDLATRDTLLAGSLVDDYGAEIVKGLLPGRAAPLPPAGQPMKLFYTSIDPQMRRRLAASIDRSLAEGVNYNYPFRLISPDGVVNNFVSTGRARPDPDGEVRSMVGIVINLTKQAEVTEAFELDSLKFDTLVAALPQIVWSADHDGQMAFFNKRWQEFTGMRQAFITMVMWRDLIHPEDWNRVSAAWRHSIATGERYDIEYRLRHHSGRFRWMHVIAMPMQDGAGGVSRWYGTATDIQDAKLLQQERELVNRELDHRISNLFTLMNGLINLSVREQPLSAPFAQDLRNRLATLHKAHRMALSHSGTDAVPLNSLLDVVLAPYRRKDGPAVAAIGAPLLLKQDLVSSFALVFHELATNAAKYGALSTQDGRLEVDVAREAGSTLICWRENGVALAGQAGEKAGFGSKLLATIVEGQFHGECRRGWTKTGVEVTMRLPSTLFLEAAGP